MNATTADSALVVNSIGLIDLFISANSKPEFANIKFTISILFSFIAISKAVSCLEFFSFKIFGYFLSNVVAAFILPYFTAMCKAVSLSLFVIKASCSLK